MDVYVCRYSVLQNIGYLLFSQKNIFSQRFCCRKGDYSKCWQLNVFAANCYNYTVASEK